MIRPVKSRMAVIAKSAVVSVVAMIVSVIAYVIWIWRKVPGMFSLDAGRLAYWPVLLGVFLRASFWNICTYREDARSF